MGSRAEPRETDHRSRSRDAAAFVGREREMEALLTGLEDATSGRGRLFVLAGEPGIGKSWLVDELASAARMRGFRTDWFEPAPPFHIPFTTRASRGGILEV
jgi:MoxR-like ATPase